MNPFEKLTLDVIMHPQRYDEHVADEVWEGFCRAVDILEWIEEESR